MQPTVPPYPTFASIQESLVLTTTSIWASIISFVPRLLAAVLIFIVGIALARWIKKLIVMSLEKIRLSQEVEKTPLHSFLKNADVTTKIEEIVASVVYWILVLVILQSTVSLLGLVAVSELLHRILLYIPNIFSAVLILFFGILLAGLAETVVKGAVKTLDGKSARLLGTVTSYLIMVIAIMAAISELGIAQQFITTLFTGLVASLALAAGLAFGLGSKDVIAKIMGDWYTKMKKEE